MFPISLYASASDSSSLEFVRYTNSVIIIIIIITFTVTQFTDPQKDGQAEWFSTTQNNVLSATETVTPDNH